jgi:hypothetical protein
MCSRYYICDYYDDKIKADEMSRTSTTHLHNQKCIGSWNVLGGQSEGKILLGRTSRKWGIVLKWCLKRSSRVWTRANWPRMGSHREIL